MHHIVPGLVNLIGGLIFGLAVPLVPRALHGAGLVPPDRGAPVAGWYQIPSGPSLDVPGPPTIEFDLPPPEADDLLLELVGRLLPGARLVPLRFPDELPFEFPLPSGSRLVGSAVQYRDGSPLEINMPMDAPGTPEEILGYYDRALSGLGWREGPQKFGALSNEAWAAINRVSRDFCRADAQQDRRIWLRVDEQATGPSAVRALLTLDVGRTNSSYCATARGPRRPTLAGEGAGAPDPTAPSILDTPVAAPREALHELIRRVLPLRSAAGRVLRLLPGGMPADLPVQIPAPAGSRLVGGAVYEGATEPGNARVFLDAPGSPTAVLAFLEQELGQQGWHRRPFLYRVPYGGLQPAAAPRVDYFCAHGIDGGLDIAIVSTGGGWSRLQIGGELNVTLPVCRDPNGVTVGVPPSPGSVDVPVPALYAPDGSHTESRPVNRWNYRSPVHEQITLETDIDAAALESHYARQLEAAGWSWQSGEREAHQAQSTWRRTALGEWQATLVVRDGAGPGTRLVSLRVEDPAGAQPSGASTPRATPLPGTPWPTVPSR
jgi:hypothetical protein